MKYQIVRCTDRDKQWLFDLHKKTMKQYVDAVYGWNEQREKEYFEDQSNFAGYHAILQDDERVGAINYYNDKNVVRIYRIEVLPDYQNKGIGSAILDKMIERSRKKHKNIELRVFKINPAHRLYLRKGFKTFKESDNHFYMRYE